VPKNGKSQCTAGDRLIEIIRDQMAPELEVHRVAMKDLHDWADKQLQEIRAFKQAEARRIPQNKSV